MMSMVDGRAMEAQFEAFRVQLDDSGAVRERLRTVVADLDNVIRMMQASLLPVHHATLQGKKRAISPRLSSSDDLWCPPPDENIESLNVQEKKCWTKRRAIYHRFKKSTPSFLKSYESAPDSTTGDFLATPELVFLRAGGPLPIASAATENDLLFSMSRLQVPRPLEKSNPHGGLSTSLCPLAGYPGPFIPQGSGDLAQWYVHSTSFRLPLVLPYASTAADSVCLSFTDVLSDQCD